MKTLLIVEDSMIFQRIIERILGPHFKIVGKGASGIEGFDLYQKLRPDLVVMDITMPHSNGKECLKRVLEFDPNGRIVMVSSVGDDQTVDECMRIGAKGFVKKEHIHQADKIDSILVQTVLRVVGSDLVREAA